MGKAWSLVLLAALAGPAAANHAVLVEGNNAANGGPGTTVVPPGTGGDWDGDGFVGTAEDTDNSTDRIFGTLGAALLAANGGVNANGRVTIVTSGRFAETIRLPNADAGQPSVNGVTLIEAAPGVEAVIDAVVAGDPGNATRQTMTGVAVATPDTDRVVVLRNLVVRNFATGLEVQGNARVIVENCRFDGNLAANVRVSDNARLTMTGSSVLAAGMRFNPTAGPPAPGDGVVFEDAAAGSIGQTTVAANTAAGIRNAGTGMVRALYATVADNGVDVDGVVDVQPAPPVCPAPVVNAAVGPCARCKTRNGVTTCRKCGISVQP